MMRRRLSHLQTAYFVVGSLIMMSGSCGGDDNGMMAAPDDTPPARIQDLMAQSPTNSSVTLTWTSPGDDGTMGTATVYDIRYSSGALTEASFLTSGTPVTSPPQPQTAGTGETFVVTGLDLDENYSFAMRTADEAGNGSAVSNVATASTLDDVAPAAVTDLSAAPTSANSVSLSWTAPGDDGSTGIATAYDIRYSTNPADLTAANWQLAAALPSAPAPLASGTFQSADATSLSAFRMYHFALRAVDNATNESEPSNIASTMTPLAFLLQWGAQGAADGQLDTPVGVAVDAAGFVYVADQLNHRIQKFTNDGSFVTKWGTQGSGDGQFNFPRMLAIGPAGNVYVADGDNHRVQKFTNDGAFLTKWGVLGTLDGEFAVPFAIAVDAGGTVFVGDQNDRIQRFDANGAFLARWGTAGTGDGQFNDPRGVAVDMTGNVYVGDGNRIQKFTATGTFLATWGAAGSGDGQFASVQGVGIDGTGRVYVSEGQNHRIQVFDSDGTFLTKWGVIGTGTGEFNFPIAVGVDASGNVFVTDHGNHRIQKFGHN